MFKDLIEKRRSVREYSDQAIAKEDLEQIVEAVYYAPTAMGKDDIELLVVTDPAKLQELSGFKPHGASSVGRAQAAIAVLSDSEVSPRCHRQDACIAATYVLLAAADLDLGACWINVNTATNEDGQPATVRLHQMLDLPDKYNIECLVALGHPAQPVEKKEPRDHQNLVHWEHF